MRTLSLLSALLFVLCSQTAWAASSDMGRVSKAADTQTTTEDMGRVSLGGKASIADK